MKIVTRINHHLGSHRFYQFILIFFGIEAVWIALSAVYPQAFDENFHYGLIQTYSHYWLPFLSAQPPHSDAFGAVARDPSYLYHYLLSFPYRIIALFVHGQIGQIILLRFINVGLFIWGLTLLRHVMQRVGASPQLTNVSLLLFVLIPVVPQVAAQINYDNLIIPLVAYSCLLVFQATDEIKQHIPSLRTLLTLLSVCLLASLVKYEFMPIFLGIVLFIIYISHQSYRWKFRLFMSHLLKSWAPLSRYVKICLVGIAFISISLFIQRDGVNLVKYHTISPNCAVVLNIQQCSSYSVWEHDYSYHQKVITKQAKANSNPVYYVSIWSYWLWYRLFFAINGPDGNYVNYPPLPLPSAAFVLIGVSGLIALIKWHRRIFEKNPYVVFLCLIIILYLTALIAEGYLKYEYTDVLELMNGRYLLPVLPFIAAIVGSAFSIALRKSPRLKEGFAILAILLFVQGGGFLTFISRSDDSWYWQNNTVSKVNKTARHITGPVLVKGKKTYGTSLWFFN